MGIFHGGLGKGRPITRLKADPLNVKPAPAEGVGA